MTAEDIVHVHAQSPEEECLDCGYQPELNRTLGPFQVFALFWVAIALFALMSPGSSLVPDLIVVGLIVVGGLYFAKMLIFEREVLDTEPGIPDAI